MMCIYLIIEMFARLFVKLSIPARPGDPSVENLTETLAHDFEELGTCFELGESVAADYRLEQEATWGPKHTAVLTEEETQYLLLGVSCLFPHNF